jgi:hypothetical protein
MLSPKEALEDMARRRGFTGVDWVEGADVPLAYIVCEGRVRVPLTAIRGDLLALDLHGQHEILHAQQIVEGRLQWGERSMVALWDGQWWESLGGPYAAARNLHTGEIVEICPWEEDAMDFEDLEAEVC